MYREFDNKKKWENITWIQRNILFLFALISVKSVPFSVFVGIICVLYVWERKAGWSSLSENDGRRGNMWNSREWTRGIKAIGSQSNIHSERRKSGIVMRGQLDGRVCDICGEVR